MNYYRATCRFVLALLITLTGCSQKDRELTRASSAQEEYGIIGAKLVAAIQNRDWEQATYILDDVNADVLFTYDVIGVTPLLAAIALENEELVKRLIQMGAPNSISTPSVNTTALEYAIGYHLQMRNVILEALPELKEQVNDVTASLHDEWRIDAESLLEAIRSGDDAAIDGILSPDPFLRETPDSGEEVNLYRNPRIKNIISQADENGFTALHAAIENEDEALVLRLLQYGAQGHYHKTADEKLTAFSYAVKYHPKLVKSMLDVKPELAVVPHIDKIVTPPVSKLPLPLAMENGDMDVAAMLAVPKARLGRYSLEYLLGSARFRELTSSSNSPDPDGNLGDVRFGPVRAIDGNPYTAWVSERAGESITIKLDRPVFINEIDIRPGNFDPRYWASASRIKSIDISMNTSKREIELEDPNYPDEIFTIQNDLDEFTGTARLKNQITNQIIPFIAFGDTITITITEIYPGRTDSRIYISEIGLRTGSQRVGTTLIDNELQDLIKRAADGDAQIWNALSASGLLYHSYPVNRLLEWAYSKFPESDIAEVIPSYQRPLYRSLPGAAVFRLGGDREEPSVSLLTPLAIAIREDNVRLVNEALNAGADPNESVILVPTDDPMQNQAISALNITPLMITRNVSIIQLLLEAGADPNVRFPEQTFIRQRLAKWTRPVPKYEDLGLHDPRTLLGRAVVEGNSKEVADLIWFGADPDVPDSVRFEKPDPAKQSGNMTAVQAAVITKNAENIAHTANPDGKWRFPVSYMIVSGGGPPAEFLFLLPDFVSVFVMEPMRADLDIEVQVGSWSFNGDAIDATVKNPFGSLTLDNLAPMLNPDSGFSGMNYMKAMEEEKLTEILELVSRSSLSQIIEKGQIDVLYRLSPIGINEPSEGVKAIIEADADELRILRNMIYARHGRDFRSKDLQEYFGRFEWYEPTRDNVDQMLTTADKLRIALILIREEGQWIDIFQEMDLVMLATTGTWGRTTPPIPSNEGPFYWFEENDEFGYGWSESSPLITGKWRLEGSAVLVLPERILNDVEVAVPVGTEQQSWRQIADFADMEFPSPHGPYVWLALEPPLNDQPKVVGTNYELFWNLEVPY